MALAVKNIEFLGNYEVLKVFESFLSMHKKNSERTANEYKSRVEEFFRMTLGKDVKFVTLEEIQSIKKADVQTKYIDALTEKGNSNNSIKTKLNSVRSFYNELLSNDLKVNPLIFKVKLPVEVTHHESLSREELEQLFEFMKDEKELAMEKYLLVKILFTTANRKTATVGVSSECGMTWEDNFVIRRDSETGEDIHVVRIKDKGNKWIEKPISDEFYDELQQINNGQKHVFNLNPKTLTRALERFSKQLGRKITAHSLKATAITLGYQMTKDIELCRQLGGHSSIATTEIYIREEKSLTNQLSYNASRELDESMLEQLSHEELLEFINRHDDIKRAILLRLSK
jgi:site-specific recombinase XerD